MRSTLADDYAVDDARTQSLVGELDTREDHEQPSTA